MWVPNEYSKYSRSLESSPGKCQLGVSNSVLVLRRPRGDQKIYRNPSTMLAVRVNGVYELQFFYMQIIPLCKPFHFLKEMAELDRGIPVKSSSLVS